MDPAFPATRDEGGFLTRRRVTSAHGFAELRPLEGAGVLSGTDYCGQLSEGWAGGMTTDTSTYKFSGIIDGVANSAECSAAGGQWQSHSYSGYSYILRADGIRVIEGMDYSEYNDLSNVPHVVDGVAYNLDENGNMVAIADLSAVPVPAAVWLFGSGLLGLVGFTRRRKQAA